MRVLVVHGSHLGSTAEIADRIGQVLAAEGLEVIVRPAAEYATEPTSVDDFDAFVIGGGIYAGRWHPDAVAFIRRHADRLLAKPTWLFSSGPLGSGGRTAEAREPVELSELAPLINARAHVVFAGAHDRSLVESSELNRLEKFVARRFVPEGDWRDWLAIEGWARSIARGVMQRLTSAV